MGAKKATRDRILEAAVRLISQKGYAETLVREIADAVGIRASSLYNHFASKEGILDAILERHRETVNRVRIPDAMLDSVAGSLSPSEFLVKGHRRIREAVETPEMSRIVRILTMEMYRNSKVRQFFLQWYFDENRRMVTRLFSKMRDRGTIRDADPEALASIYSAFVNAFYQELFLRRAEGRNTKGLESRLERQARLFAEMLRK